MNKKIALPLTLAVLSAIALFLVVTQINPIGKEVVVVILPIILLWITLASLARTLLVVLGVSKNKSAVALGYGGASLIVILLLLRGVGQLTVVDGALVVALIVLMSFYFSRTWSK